LENEIMPKPVVFITGATSGIGRAAALTLAREGFRVFGTGRRVPALESLKGETGGLSLETFILDVTDEGSIGRAVIEVDRLTDGYGVDVLVNNAGYGQFGPVEKVSDADVRAQFETNVFGLLKVTRAFLPQMRERGSGRIINVSSLAGTVAFPFTGVYNASKFAVEAVSDAMRREMRHLGIHVVLIQPGFIRTEFSDVVGRHVEDYREDMGPWETGVERFETMFDKMARVAPGPDIIARAILKAAVARRPKARYSAPFKDRFLTWMGRALPTRLVDWGQRAALGLKRKG